LRARLPLRTDGTIVFKASAAGTEPFGFVR
jgi:hypothetical protein